MIAWHQERVQDLLIDEVPIVLPRPSHGERRLDGLIIPDARDEPVYGEPLDIAGRDVIVVQAKARRLGMPLMGQTLLSLGLVRALCPASATSVALCTANDSVFGPLLEDHEGCFVEVYAPEPGMD